MRATCSCDGARWGVIGRSSHRFSSNFSIAPTKWCSNTHSISNSTNAFSLISLGTSIRLSLAHSSEIPILMAKDWKSAKKPSPFGRSLNRIWRWTNGIRITCIVNRIWWMNFIRILQFRPWYFGRGIFAGIRGNLGFRRRGTTSKKNFDGWLYKNNNTSTLSKKTKKL